MDTSSDIKNQIFTALKTYYGFDGFRPLQEEIVTSIATGHDTIALLPTGGGKSLCFQIPALVLPGITLVISPLISLMTDQVMALKNRGVNAVCITSQASDAEKKEILRLLSSPDPQIKLVYVSPERLAQKKFQQTLKNLPISLIVLDEAHCLSQWGHEFRPAYLDIVHHLRWLRNDQKHIPIAAFTATATQQVIQELQDILELQKVAIYRASFARKNLDIVVTTITSQGSKELLLCHFIAQNLDTSGIIYAATQKATEHIAQLVNHFLGNGETICYPYHAGLESTLRQKTQDGFLKNEIKIIAATNAFGMGVDKPNVRWVAHYHFPGSIEAYYQEIGRAGRDGNAATCLLLADPADTVIHQSFIANTKSDRQRQHEMQLLEVMYAYMTSKSCRTKHVLEYFNETNVSQSCESCDICKPDLIKILKLPQHELGLRHCTILHAYGKKHKVDFPFILTPLQQAWVMLLKPKTAADFKKIPGIGQGWIDTWYNILK